MNAAGRGARDGGCGQVTRSANTGAIVAAAGPITGFDPHFVELVDDYMILYSHP